MTNLEWLIEVNKNVVINALSGRHFIALRKDTGELDYCSSVHCANCAFHTNTGCIGEISKWLEAEHVEKPIDPHWTIDTKVLVSTDGETWFKRYYVGFNESSDSPYLTYCDGATSWSAGEDEITYWRYAKLAEQASYSLKDVSDAILKVRN